MDSAQLPAYSFIDGVLHIDLPRARMRLHWCPKPMAEELPVGLRKWREFWPEFRLIYPQGTCNRQPAYVLEIPVGVTKQEILGQRVAAFAAFREQLPPEIVRIVEPFGSHQWALMALMHAELWARDLAKGNPVLAYAFASSYKFRGSPPEAAAVQARWYCHKKQRDLLAWLGFPGTDAVVKLIRKIPPESASPSILRRLCAALKADKRVLEYLSHLKVVNAAVLELVTIRPYLDLITPKLLLEMAEEPGEVSLLDIFQGGMAILQKISPRPVIKPFTCVKQVRGFQEAAAAQYQDHLRRQELARQEARRLAELDRHRQYIVEMAYRRRKKELQNKGLQKDYPSPPVPGTKDIIPLTSAGELHAEGKDLGHCVATYEWQVRLGSTYIYRIMAPERATLSIVRGADGRWYRAELKGPGNRKVKPATERMVDLWLEGARVSI